MVAPFLIVLAAVTLRQDATLRSGCEAGDDVVAQAQKGEPVEVRFALAGSGCYRISTRAGTGYVRGSELEGLEEFERGRAGANPMVNSVKVTRVAVEAVEKAVSVKVDAGGPLASAMKLIDSNQPLAALASLDSVLKRPRPDPTTLLVAGIAAWRGDDSRRALEYWKAALQQHPDPTLQSLYDRVQREATADRSAEKSFGLRVALRYEGESVRPEIARAMVDTLDAEYSRIALTLGCRTEERLTAIVQSRAAYLKTTGGAEWSGGQYDGRIRIALADEEGVGPKTRRLFAHELVHACLASLGSWPSWLHEGMAQRLSGDRLSPQALQALAALAREHRLPKLEALGQNWSGMTQEQARAAYGLALHAADRLMEDYESYGIRNILANRAKLKDITTALDREFGAAE